MEETMGGKAYIPSQCINLTVHYFKDPKVERLIGLLGRNSEVLPIRLWCHCGEHHAENGALTGYAEQEIESACKWWGDHGVMVKAFVKLKLLEKRGNTYYVHDWLEWQGHIEAFKARGRRNRAKQLLKLSANSPASSRTGSPATGLDWTGPPKAPQGGRGEARNGRGTKHEKMLERLKQP